MEKGAKPVAEEAGRAAHQLAEGVAAEAGKLADQADDAVNNMADKATETAPELADAASKAVDAQVCPVFPYNRGKGGEPLLLLLSNG